MNNYIIDPAWIYWVNICDAVKTMFIVIAVLSASVLVALLIATVADELVFDDVDADYAKIKKLIRFVISVTLLSTAAAIFIPNATTLIGLKVTELVTQSNIDFSTDALKSVVDYIVEAIKSVK